MTAPALPVLLLCFELPPSAPADSLARLQAHYEVIPLWLADDRAACIARHRERVQVLATNAFLPTDAAFIDQFPALRAICNLGVGYDNIDMAHARQRGIVVSNTPGVLDDCVADLGFGLMLAALRGMGQAERYARAGKWTTRLPALPLGRRVTGKRLGIVGLGRIGLAIAQRAQGFAMPIRYHNRRARNDVPYEYADSLRELAGWADILMVATTGGPGTRHLIDADVLRALGPESFLINLARGSVIDESALVQALEQGVIAGAGLDVFDDEPHIPPALLTLENVVLMPHIASATLETRQAMVGLMVDNLCSYAANGRLVTEVQA